MMYQNPAAMSPDLLCLPLDTARLQLRRFQPRDLAAYAGYHCRDDVYRYLYQPAPDQDAVRDQFTALLAAPFHQDGDSLHLCVTRRKDEQVLGEVLLKIGSLSALQLEVGYIFDPAASGQGYATEAVRAMLQLGFEKLGAHRIFARLDALNLGSIGIVERLHFRREAHLIQNDCFQGVWGDELIYAMLRSEWEARA